MSSTDQPDPSPSDHQVEVVIDLGAFLPETSAIGPLEPEADPTGEPELAPGDQPEVGPDGGATKPAPVDLSVLAGIEADLAAVDQAIEAIDAGDVGRSPLLTELLGPPAG